MARDVLGSRWTRGLAVVVAALVIPWIFPQRYFLRVADLALIYAVLSLGLQLLAGSAGQLSLGHAAFFGTGAYTSALLITKLGVAPELAFGAGAIVAGLLAVTLMPITRLRGNELAVATLGFGVIIHAGILNEEWLTEGPLGVMRIPPFRLGPILFDSEFRFYYVALVTTILVYGGFRRLTRSRFGRALEAIRQSEEAARASGINPVVYKSKVFVIAAFTAGMAGALFAHVNGYLNPNDFTLAESINILMMVVVGGLQTLEGAVVGAVVLVFASEYLRAFKEYRMAIYGALLILFMIFGTEGLRGLPGLVLGALGRMFPRGPRPRTEGAGRG